MKDKKKILMVLGVVSIVLITIGIGYAFFSYSKNGTTENTISSDSITFLYDEVDQQGNGITLTNALPISDTEGKGQIQDFDFRIVSDTSTGISIPYEITLRKKVGSDDIDDIIKVYLAKTTDSSTTIANEEEVELSKYSDLETVTKNGHQEKLLHVDKVPGSNSTYNQGYRLKMWIDDSADYSEITVPAKCSDGSNKTEQECTSPNEWIAEHNEYPYNNKTFAVTVNVYANGHTITQQDIEAASRTDITSFSVDGITLSGSNNYYEANVAPGSTEATINVETENPYTTVVIEKTDSTYENVIAMNSGIQKLSTSKKISLTNTDNYFRIRLTSEDGIGHAELHLKIHIISLEDLTREFEYSSTAETHEYTYSAPLTGYYQIEVWGAQGGDSIGGTGGYGGYTVGTVHLTAFEELYINVGESPADVTASTSAGTRINGGYNGGGSGCGRGSASTSASGGAGGGATHVATSNGLLSELSENRSSIIIVAGGGGGAGYNNDSDCPRTATVGGSGGGNTGVTGTVVGNCGSPKTTAGGGGTQTTGGTAATYGSDGGFTGAFGQGGRSGNQCTSYAAGAGGGGYFGGGSGNDYGAAGGGGSGYINTTKLTNAKMYCFKCTESTASSTYTINTNPAKTIEEGATDERDLTNCPNGYSSEPIAKCAKADNGYAKITYIGN